MIIMPWYIWLLNSRILITKFPRTHSCLFVWFKCLYVRLSLSYKDPDGLNIHHLNIHQKFYHGRENPHQVANFSNYLFTIWNYFNRIYSELIRIENWERFSKIKFSKMKLAAWILIGAQDCFHFKSWDLQVIFESLFGPWIPDFVSFKIESP